MTTLRMAGKPWAVYTMTHYDEMYDHTGAPVDAPGLNEWCIGVEVDFDGAEYEARSAGAVAEHLTYGLAVYISELHNRQLALGVSGDALGTQEDERDEG
jgi:hypothetical protein